MIGKMNAWVLHGIGDIRYEEVNTPVPKEGEALVSVKAAGICGSDIPRIFETGAHTHPLIPGHEFSGVVESVGGAADKAWTGRRVAVFPLLPCGRCKLCLAGKKELCRSYGYLGSRQNGGFAEYAAVPVKNLLALPDGVSFEEAAMLEPLAVAVHAMRRAELFPAGDEEGSYKGKRAFRGHAVGRADGATYGKAEPYIAICGLGTIGMCLLMLLLEAGHRRVLAIGNKAFQGEAAEALGLSPQDFCDGGSEDAAAWIYRRTDGNGGDVFFECVGRNETVSLAVDCAAPCGRVVYVGNPRSDMVFSRDTYWKILRNELQITGSWNSAYAR